jgi:hypothetical protein
MLENGAGVVIHPVTPDRWDDLVALFERRSRVVERRCLVIAGACPGADRR